VFHVDFTLICTVTKFLCDGLELRRRELFFVIEEINMK
jgi:hypothetical protein